MVQTSCLLFGGGNTSKTLGVRRESGLVVRSAVFILLAVLAMALPYGSAQGQSSTYVPPVVSSAVTTVPTTTYVNPTGTQTNLVTPTTVQVDACGNIYTLDTSYGGAARLTEIPAGGGAPTIAAVAGNYNASTGQDPLHANLLIGLPYNTGYDLIPVGTCVPQGSQAMKVGGGNGALFYYYNPQAAAGDFAGNTYISTNGTCCVTGSFYLIQEVAGNGNILLANQPNAITSIAVDKLQNVYFVTGSAVFELTFSAGKYAAAPVSYGSFLNPVGLSVDSAGDLFVADSSAGAIYEIPNEGTTGPNLQDQFVVSSGLNINVAVAVNARGDMYYTAAGASSVSELTLGNANFNSVAPGQTVTRVVNFQFNTAVTLKSIQAPTGDFTIQAPNPGTTNCAASGTYGPAGTKSCQLTVSFSPTTVGKQSSSIVLTYSNGTSTATETAYLEGVGQGALLTLDPGTATSADSGVHGPAGIAVDRLGNTFIADAANNAIVEYPAGGGAAVTIAISSGTSGVQTALSKPLGVAVDGGGDVFIADTGNNRVVEVPFLNGALSPAASTVIASGLKSPASVFVHTNGDLYVADTGDNTILLYPNFSGTTNAGSAFGAATKLGAGLSAPLAVTVDAAGDVFIADSGNNQILEYPLGGGQEIVAADILNPSGLATDSSGSLFVVDQGNFRVLRIPSSQGSLNPNGAAEVALGVANPYGVALDSAANLYVTDQTNAAAYTFARSQLALGFGDLPVGTASTALPLTVESAGNLPLVFNSPYFTETGNATDFAMTSPTGACTNGLTLAAGSSCDLSTTFQPTMSGSRSATITFSSNAGNKPQLNLTGSGVSPSPTTTTLALITSVAGAPFYGEPLSFTATVAPGSGTPTGVVAFIVDGTQVGLLPLVKGVATLPLNSGLTGGAHTVYAVYKGDASNNGSSSAVQNVSIARAPTTPTIVITKIPYNNPYSLRHSNAGSCSVMDNTGNVDAFPALVSDAIGFTASVTSPGVGVPSGTLTFYSDGKPINGAAPGAPSISLAAGGSFPANQTVYVLLTLVNDANGETTAGPSANITTTAADGSVSVALASSYGPAGTSVNIYEADVPAGSAAPTSYQQVGNYPLGSTAVISKTASGKAPPAANTSITPLLPAAGGIFSGSITSDADTLGDGTTLGENNVLVTPHQITVVYSGDQNYLPSTSVVTTVTVTDVSKTTPITLPPTPVGTPPSYCTATSPITVSEPSIPAAFSVTAASNTVSATAAAPGTIQFTISSLSGWVGTISMACPNLPQYTTCTANPGIVTLSSSTPGATVLPTQVTMTFTTNVPPYVPTASQSGFFWLPTTLLGFAMLSSRRYLRKGKGSLAVLGLVILLAGSIGGLSGCSTSSNSTAVTPAGSYPFTVVFTGAEIDPFEQYSQQAYRSDVPYSVSLNLNVK